MDSCLWVTPIGSFNLEIYDSIPNRKKSNNQKKKIQSRNSNGLNNHVSRRDCKLSFHKRYKLSYQQNFLIEKKRWRMGVSISPLIEIIGEHRILQWKPRYFPCYFLWFSTHTLAWTQMNMLDMFIVLSIFSRIDSCSFNFTPKRE